MRDKERGVIWEECIILLPSAVRFVFLSATLPNGREFAAWVAATHGLPCHLVTTPYRPTPLQHWVFPVGSPGLHLLVDEQGCFREPAYAAACAALRAGAAAGPAAAPARLGARHSPELLRLLRLLVGRDLTPSIVFSFSRKECESAARCAQALDPLPVDERRAVTDVFEGAIATLSADDQHLKQVALSRPMLARPPPWPTPQVAVHMHMHMHLAMHMHMRTSVYARTCTCPPMLLPGGHAAADAGARRRGAPLGHVASAPRGRGDPLPGAQPPPHPTRPAAWHGTPSPLWSRRPHQPPLAPQLVFSLRSVPRPHPLQAINPSQKSWPRPGQPSPLAITPSYHP